MSPVRCEVRSVTSLRDNKCFFKLLLHFVNKKRMFSVSANRKYWIFSCVAPTFERIDLKSQDLCKIDILANVTLISTQDAHWRVQLGPRRGTEHGMMVWSYILAWLTLCFIVMMKVIREIFASVRGTEYIYMWTVFTSSYCKTYIHCADGVLVCSGNVLFVIFGCGL